MITTINILFCNNASETSRIFYLFLKKHMFSSKLCKKYIFWSNYLVKALLLLCWLAPLTWILGGGTPWPPRLLRPWYYNTSSVTMLDHLEWETLESRRIKNQLTMLFKIIHGLADFPASDYLSPANTRTRSNLWNLHSFHLPRLISHWNELQATVAEYPDLVSFKKRISSISI